MKKIGLVTFHRSNSYGASLQAFATTEFLRDNGYDIEIVDYTNAYEQRFQKLIHTENGKLSGYVTAFIKDFFLKKRYYTKQAFGNLTKYYTISSERYSDKNSLNNAKYDVLIAGSDQIWNKEITNGIDDVYLLQFGTASKRISIASSMGSTNLNEEDKKIFKKALKSFSSISIREEHAKRQLEELTDKPIKILLDPTFLFSKAEWIRKLGCKSKYYRYKGKYILTFFVAPNNTYKDRVQGYADLLNIPVWSIQSTKLKRTNCKRSIPGAMIEDLIAMIAGAELVITDSFHGVALSLNFQQNFVAFKNFGNPVRVAALLQKFGIYERLDMMPHDYQAVNYEEVGKILEPLCKDSKQWIIKAIES